MARVNVELPDGTTGWVEFRPMTMGDVKYFIKAEDALGSMARLEQGILGYEFSNGKALDDQVKGAYRVLLRAWNNAEDEVALPPANGLPSELPSLGRSTERQPVIPISTASTRSRGATGSRRGRSTRATGR